MNFIPPKFREHFPDGSTPEDDGSKIQDAPFRERRLALIIGGLFFVLFLGWAVLTPLDAAAIATGNIAVSGNKKTVQHSQGGIVSSLKVVEGQNVKAGETLLTINSTAVAATERGIAGEVYSLLAERERLIAERDGLGSFSAPREFADIPEADLLLARQAMQGQLRLFEARRGSLGSRKGVLGQRSKQNDEQVNGLQRQLVSNREQQRLINEELTALRELEKRGFASKSRVREVERTAAALLGNEGQIEAQIAGAREASGENRMQTVTLETEVVEQASTRLRDVNVRLDELLPRLGAVREELERTKVKAPVDGKVVGMSVFTIGGVVAPGEVLMQIVPQDRELVIQATINPTDADDIKLGQEAQVRFAALQERNLPILLGRVTKLSADSFTDERTGESFFRAEIKVPEDQLEIVESVRGGVNPLKPGLPAEIIIPMRKRSVLQYLVEPLSQMLWLAGREN